MPSPVLHKRKGGSGLYRRKDGAVRIGKKGFSRHSPQLDRKRSARKATRHKVERYPQAFD